MIWHVTLKRKLSLHAPASLYVVIETNDFIQYLIVQAILIDKQVLNFLNFRIAFQGAFKSYDYCKSCCVKSFGKKRIYVLKLSAMKLKLKLEIKLFIVSQMMVSETNQSHI